MNCPLCNAESTIVFRAKGFPVRDCKSCGHRFAEVAAAENHVAEIYGDAYFTGGGAGYADYLAEAEMLRGRGRDYAKILSKYVGKSGAMLDVGAAAGFVLQGFIDENWRGRGVEPNAGMAKYGREKLSLDI